ncbi:hypothetical protein DBO90_09105 [Mycobacterium avium]|nr:hypothetical protein DBO90_09105 [Mycobacterium avium]
MHKAFQLLQPCLREFLGIDGGVDKAFLPRVLDQTTPGRARTLGIEGDPMRAQIDEAQPHADRTLDNALLDVDPEVERGRHRITDVFSQKCDEAATRILLAGDDLAIGRLHEQPDLLLEGPGFLSEMLQHGVDVPGDLLDLVPRVAVDDEHDVVTDVAERFDPMQQIPNRLLRVADPVREFVDGAGQGVTLLTDSRCGSAYFGQSVIDLLAFGNLLTVEQRLGRVEGSLHPVQCRGETVPTGCGRVQARHVAVGPHFGDERLYDRPQQWWRLSLTPGPRGPGRGKVSGRGRRRQSAASAAERRGRFGRRIIRRALLDQGPAFAARVDDAGRGLQHRLGRVLIPQAEHLAGTVNTRVGRNAGRQDRQVRRQRIADGRHGAAGGIHRLRINRQGSHVRNFRSSPRVAATHPMIAPPS